MTREQGKKVPVIAVDEQELRSHVSEVVRQSAEETLDGLLEAEANALCQARRYERNAQRASTRAGHYELKNGANANLRQNAPMSLWTASGSNALGPEKCKTSRCLWPSG